LPTSSVSNVGDRPANRNSPHISRLSRSRSAPTWTGPSVSLQSRWSWPAAATSSTRPDPRHCHPGRRGLPFRHTPQPCARRFPPAPRAARPAPSPRCRWIRLGVPDETRPVGPIRTPPRPLMEAQPAAVHGSEATGPIHVLKSIFSDMFFVWSVRTQVPYAGASGNGATAPRSASRHH
jgi:hypothetical protein